MSMKLSVDRLVNSWGDIWRTVRCSSRAVTELKSKRLMVFSCGLIGVEGLPRCQIADIWGSGSVFSN